MENSFSAHVNTLHAGYHNAPGDYAAEIQRY